MADDTQRSFTPAGNLKAPTLDILAQWVLESWEDVKKPVVEKSFKKCCISNKMDGTEDDILWDHRLRDREITASDQEDEIADNDDPYNDQIPLSDWEDLFLGNHDDEDADTQED